MGTQSHVAFRSAQQCERTSELFCLTKVTVYCSFLAIMFSNLPQVLVWGLSFVKRLRSDLERPSFQVDLISRASILTTDFYLGFDQVDIISRASPRFRYNIRSHKQPFLVTEFKHFTVKIPDSLHHQQGYESDVLDQTPSQFYTFRNSVILTFMY